MEKHVHPKLIKKAEIVTETAWGNRRIIYEYTTSPSGTGKAVYRTYDGREVRKIGDYEFHVVIGNHQIRLRKGKADL